LRNCVRGAREKLLKRPRGNAQRCCARRPSRPPNNAPPLADPDTWGPTWWSAHVQPLSLVHGHTFPPTHSTVHTVPALGGEGRSKLRGGGVEAE
jgi:hypothetical protein